MDYIFWAANHIFSVANRILVGKQLAIATVHCGELSLGGAAVIRH
jgi:hypothetical protein